MLSWARLSDVVNRQLPVLERDGLTGDAHTACKEFGARAAAASTAAILNDAVDARDERVDEWASVLEARLQQLAALLKDVNEEEANFEWSKALCERESNLLKTASEEETELTSGETRDADDQGAVEFDCSASYDQVIRTTARWTAHMKQERELRALRDVHDAELLALQEELERAQQAGLEELSLHAAQAADMRSALQAGQRDLSSREARVEGNDYCTSPRSSVLPAVTQRTHRELRPASEATAPSPALPQPSSIGGMTFLRSSRAVVSTGVSNGTLQFWLVPSRGDH